MNTPMMNPAEWFFLCSNIERDMTVLEWGFGVSTQWLAGLVARVVSMEHNSGWYEMMRNKVPANVEVHLVGPSEPHDGPSDGTYEQYQQYVDRPFTLGYKYDVAIIDGRARSACAEKASEHIDRVFIHDFSLAGDKSRREYLRVFSWYDLEDICGCLALLRRRDG